MAVSIQDILKNYEPKRENLMPILHDVNDTHGFVNDSAMQKIAKFLSISSTEVYGKTTFYAFFNTEQKGEYIIRLCKSLSCDIIGKKKISETLKKELGIGFGETTADKKFTLEYTNCMGMCDIGPSMLVNKVMNTHLTPEKIKSVISDLKKGVPLS